MTLRVCTWNINSPRLREAAVLRLLREEGPDVLCLQETKSPVDKLPLEGLRALGYQHVTARTSVMNSQARTEPNDFDRSAALIAFQRPPGNRSPDVDPTSASINRLLPATWSAPIR